MATVSVIIPNFNRANLVAETIENMLNQTLPPYEVIVVDDGSTDNSVEIIKSFGDRVTLIQQANLGPGAARNAALKVASGEFVQFMDSDDLASLNKLEEQTKALIENKADMVYSPWIKVFIDGSHIQIQDVVLQQAPVPSNKDLVTWFLTGWSIVFQQWLFRASFVKKVGYYRTDVRTNEDTEFFLRMLLFNPKVVFEKTALTLYRLNDYGKLTESGTTSRLRVENWGKFLLSANQLCRASIGFQSIVESSSFYTNVWKTLEVLKSVESKELYLIQDLTSLLQQSNYFPLWAVRSRLGEIRGGIQQRILGHRWSPGYMGGSLNPRQKYLIEELGFSVKSQPSVASKPLLYIFLL